MNLGMTMHLVAGLGALGMGTGILVRGPRGARDRLFALLCAALALWNLAFLGRLHSGMWRPIYLFGSCAAAALGLHFVLALTSTPQPARRRLLIPAYSLAALMWISSWAPVPVVSARWNSVAIVVLGGILLTGLVVLARHALWLPAGAERRTLFYVLGGGVLAAAGGMSDFIPRSSLAITQLGPIGVVLFLLIVTVVLVRFRFLDVDVVLTRLVALIAGAAIAALTFFGLTRFISDSFAALFLTSLALLVVAVPLGRLILTRSRMSRAPADPLRRALLAISQRLPRAMTAEAVWSMIEEQRRALPFPVRIDVYLRRSHQQNFHLFFRSEGFEDVDASPVGLDSTLPRALERERLPLTRRYLELEQPSDDSLGEFDRLDLHLVAPFFLRDRVGGWIALGGQVPEQSLTVELAGDFMLVANQAAAALNRIEAMDMARRKEALATAGELAAGLAHEVRNPVAAIRGAGQAMGPSATPEQREEMLEVIEEESERLGRVVGEFLSYARPEVPHREPVDVAALVRRVAQSMELAGMKLRVELHENGRIAPALGDPDQLHRVLENLMRNAWEATGDGGRLRVDLSNVKNRRIAVRLEDNGPGIPATDVPRLFQPFYAGRPHGTGLGLALVHRIVEAHQGEISVEGRPGIGAAFTVIVPAADDDAGPGRESGSGHS